MPFWNCFKCMRFRNDEFITKLDLSNCALADVPPDISQHERTLEEIILSSNRIRALSPQLFYCQEVRVLFVNDNELESLPNAIGSLRQLQNLNLSRNGLSTIPDNIKSCKNLTRLDLSLNNLQRIPDAITCLISLQELLLNETNLEFLPANFGRLVNLRILELRSNNLITLPKSMSRLSNLNRIDIGANEFTELPEVICQLSQLRELWIDVNRIRRISPNVSNLRELKHFEANNNLLLTLPSEISNWPNLEVLSVSTNDIESLPFSIGMLKSLVTLHCEANQLRELPDSICHLENLEEMVINHNFISRLPSTIGMLKKLRFFCADENILRNLPLEICSCENLAVLSVRSNKITELPQNIGHLINLQVLNLVDNYISYLPVAVLNLTKLTALWISDNQSQPLVPLQYLDTATKSFLTCFMLPQQELPQHNENSESALLPNTWFSNQNENKNHNSVESYSRDREVQNKISKAGRAERVCFSSTDVANDGSFDASQNYCVTSMPRRICFADEVKGSETTRLMRSPTPYPKELRLMAKYVRNNRNDQLQQQQQQQVSYADNMLATRSLSVPTTYEHEKKYLSTTSLGGSGTGAGPDEVKEARVLLNPSGSSQPLYQIQNTVSYRLTERPNVDGIHPTSASPIDTMKSRTNGILAHQQTLDIDMNDGHQTPTAYICQPILGQQQQQQQCHLHFQNLNTNDTAPGSQLYSHLPSIYDDQLADIFSENSKSLHQLSASPSANSFYLQLGSEQVQNAAIVQTSKPPPYHIARTFTKKSREDLLNYDSIRNQITHDESNVSSKCYHFDSAGVSDYDKINGGQNQLEYCENKMSNHRSYTALNEHDDQFTLDTSLRPNMLNDNEYDSVDYKNNNSSTLNRIYSVKNKDALGKCSSLLSLQALENGSFDGREEFLQSNQPEKWNTPAIEVNDMEVANSAQEAQCNTNNISWRTPSRSNSTTTWLFGLHKNPTVRQLTIKRDQEIGFEIQEKPKQGIFVSAIYPNTSAAVLLQANDKLLEVDGYDFTKIPLVDAQQILDNSGYVINVMISRT